MNSVLDAVNRVLQAAGERPVLALDTGGASQEADAERILTRSAEDILSHGPLVLSGFGFNLDFGLVLGPGTHKFTFTSIGGAFLPGEPFTGIGVTGRVVEFVTGVAGGSEAVIETGEISGLTAITGSDSGATGTVTDPVAVVAGRIAVPHGTILWRPALVDRRSNSTGERVAISQRAGFFYDDVNAVNTFSAPITIDRSFSVPFENLPPLYARWAEAEAGVEFQRFVRRDSQADQINLSRAFTARSAALRAALDEAPVNIFARHGSRRLAGFREDSL